MELCSGGVAGQSSSLQGGVAGQSSSLQGGVAGQSSSLQGGVVEAGYSLVACTGGVYRVAVLSRVAFNSPISP